MKHWTASWSFLWITRSTDPICHHPACCPHVPEDLHKQNPGLTVLLFLFSFTSRRRAANESIKTSPSADATAFGHVACTQAAAQAGMDACLQHGSHAQRMEAAAVYSVWCPADKSLQGFDDTSSESCRSKACCRQFSFIQLG